MKKLLAILLAAMVGISLALCSCGESEETSSGAETAGGWTAPDSPVVTKEVRAALEKACEKLTGATYEPIAYLGSQVVAGTNYRILCKRTLSAMIAEPTYAIVTVYEDLEGNAEITEILTSEATVNVTDVAIDGGWAANETLEMTKEAADALTNGTKRIVGSTYSSVALLATQIVSGTNYCMLCEVTPVTENPESYYAIVVVYKGADGNTSMVETYAFSSEAAE